MTSYQRRKLIRFRRGAFDVGVGVIVLLVLAGLYLLGGAAARLGS
jgi:hypothetical protein